MDGKRINRVGNEKRKWNNDYFFHNFLFLVLNLIRCSQAQLHIQLTPKKFNKLDITRIVYAVLLFNFQITFPKLNNVLIY